MPMYDRARDMAACLGLEEALLRRLQARGSLLAFDLSEAEIRERLYQGHRRYLLRPRSSGTSRSSASSARPQPAWNDATAAEGSSTNTDAPHEPTLRTPQGRHPAFDVVSDGVEVGRDLAARRLVPPVVAFLPRRSLPEFVDDRGERRQDLGKRPV